MWKDKETDAGYGEIFSMQALKVAEMQLTHTQTDASVLGVTVEHSHIICKDNIGHWKNSLYLVLLLLTKINTYLKTN